MAGLKILPVIQPVSLAERRSVVRLIEVGTTGIP